LKEKVATAVWKTKITAVGIRRADQAISLYPQKLALTLPTSGGRSVGIVRSRTKATELQLVLVIRGGAGCSVVLKALLQAGRSRVRDPMR
jgi:hypothetical protein